MTHDQVRSLLKNKNQEHLLSFVDSITDEEKEILFSQISSIDWRFLDKHNMVSQDLGAISPIDIMRLSEIKSNSSINEATGIKAIKDGKLCLLLLAGGQGTRLGYDQPKGTFNIGIQRELYIFELLIEHIMEIVKLSDSWIHLYIMTSELNNAATVSFFKEHDYFGYNPEYIHFFAQEMNPATDYNGKILMSSPYTIAMSPNGNGGWFSSLDKSGFLKDMNSSGIEWINVFAVDNVLQRIADPVFLGATINSKKACGAKVISKAAPDEKIGTICLENGKPHIIEYYELSEEYINMQNSDGTLSYGYGVILNYMFPIRILNKTLGTYMPLHVVEKKVSHINSEGKLVTPQKPNAYKYETLALDLIHEMDDCLAFEVEREKEFAPVKNSTGVDSIDSARDLLEKNGYIL